MERDWRKRLRDLIEGTPGLDMKSLSRKAGLNDAYIAQMYSKPSTPTVDVFLKIAAAAGVSATWLLTGEEDSPLQIPVLGKVNGEAWSPVQGMTVEPTLRDFDLVSFMVEGDAMAAGGYRNGDLLICQRTLGKNASNLVGQDCVVETADGERFLKILQRGPRPNVYNLRSYNPAVKDIEGVAIAWAAPVHWIKRAAGR